MQYRRDKSQEEIAQSQEGLTVEYNRLRNKLEAEVRRLQGKLEASRTMYQVNADQIGHDYRLLEGKSSSNEHKIKKGRKNIQTHKQALAKVWKGFSLSESHNQN